MKRTCNTKLKIQGWVSANIYLVRPNGDVQCCQLQAEGVKWKIEDSPLNEHRTWWERYKRTYINIMPHFKYVLFKGLYVKEWHRERSTNYLVSTFGWKEICWIWGRQNLRQVLCQLSICVSQVHFPLLLFLSNSENCFLGSTAHCLVCGWV